MSIEQNRALAIEFYDLMSKLEFDEMFALMADDATWTVAGKPETFWAAGTQTKAERAVLFNDFTKVFSSMETRILSTTAEDDRVAVELLTKADTPKGLVYENEFLILFRFKNNKIVSILEHLDQQTTLAFTQALHDSEQQ